MEVQMDENGQWGIVELMGHKVVAGLVSKSEMIGDAMLRVDVPATSAYPAFTQLYGTAAIYAVTFVSEDVRAAVGDAGEVPEGYPGASGCYPAIEECEAVAGWRRGNILRLCEPYRPGHPDTRAYRLNPRRMYGHNETIRL
jgi:hypothetical protein